MRILYISCHSVLEYDEILLLSELGHEVFPLGGFVYLGGYQGFDFRPLEKSFINPDLTKIIEDEKDSFSRGIIPPDFLSYFDLIIVMHDPQWLYKNWHNLKKYPVIWRSIGQSNRLLERSLHPFVRDGLKIIRYSPKERNITDYAGESGIVRFYKDPNEFKGWIGSKSQVLSVIQEIIKRGIFNNLSLFQEMANLVPIKLYGPGNDLLPYSMGMASYDELKEAYRTYRCFFYTGTIPASYTLSFIEAFMTGIPVVALGHELFNYEAIIQDRTTYEVPDFITHGEDGFVCHSVEEIKYIINCLLSYPNLAKSISEKGRARAIELFSKDKAKEAWKGVL
jgi:glycosyltransferase involved in cell wall biosynthesis